MRMGASTSNAEDLIVVAVRVAARSRREYAPYRQVTYRSPGSSTRISFGT